MPNLPPIIYGVNDRQPPNMLTLIVWRKLFGVPIPITMQFPVMPESLMILKQYLTTVTPTRDGGWVDDYGPAPSPIDISGTFGRNTKGYFNGGLYNGFGWVKYLEWMVDESHRQLSDGSVPKVWLMSHASQHFLEVELMSFNLSETISRNMIWTYALKATILRPITGEPTDDGILDNLVKTVIEQGHLKAVGEIGKVFLG